MESKLNLVSSVFADLPEELFMESIEKPSSTISSLSKHKREKGSKIFDAICEMFSCRMQVGLSKRELDLMQQQEARVVKRNNIRRMRKPARKKKKVHDQRAPL